MPNIFALIKRTRLSGEVITLGPYPYEEAQSRMEKIWLFPGEVIGLVDLTEEEAHALRNGGVK